MADEQTLGNYLHDLGPLLLERAERAKADRDAASSGSDRDFANGRLMGLDEAISLLELQADAFGIDRRRLGLAEVNPERDLL